MCMLQVKKGQHPFCFFFFLPPFPSLRICTQWMAGFALHPCMGNTCSTSPRPKTQVIWGLVGVGGWGGKLSGAYFLMTLILLFAVDSPI